MFILCKESRAWNNPRAGRVLASEYSEGGRQAAYCPCLVSPSAASKGEVGSRAKWQHEQQYPSSGGILVEDLLKSFLFSSALLEMGDDHVSSVTVVKESKA